MNEYFILTKTIIKKDYKIIFQWNMIQSSKEVKFVFYHWLKVVCQSFDPRHETTIRQE